MIKTTLSQLVNKPVKFDILKNRYSTFTSLTKAPFLRRTCIGSKNELKFGYSRKDNLDAKMLLKRCFHLTKTRSLPPLGSSNIFIMALGATHTGLALFTKNSVKQFSQMQTVLGGTAIVTCCSLGLTILEISGLNPFTEKDLVPISNRERSFKPKDHAESTKIELRKINNVYKEFAFPDNTPETKHVKRVLLNVLKANPEINVMKEFDHWNVKLVKDDQCCNTWMLPDGSLFAFSGLLKNQTDDQLAAFIGVEIAEVIMKHKAEEENIKLKYRLSELMFVPAIWSLYMIPVPMKIGIHLASIGAFEGIMAMKKKIRIYEAKKAGIQFAQKANYNVNFDIVRNKPRELHPVQKSG